MLGLEVWLAQVVVLTPEYLFGRSQHSLVCPKHPGSLKVAFLITFLMICGVMRIR